MCASWKHAIKRYLILPDMNVNLSEIKEQAHQCRARRC